jgi:hypothetical protein
MTPMIKNKFISHLGQNVLEYSLILVLVAAGIIMGTPFVRRSWNAYVQSIEENVHDSIHDPFDQAPANNLACVCGALYGRPPDTCGFGECGIFEYRQARDCFPFGCADDRSTCRAHHLCCTEWIQDDCGSRVTYANPCPNAHMAYWKKCGDNRIYSKCEPDSRCHIRCVGEINGQPGDPNATWCYPGEFDTYLIRPLTTEYVNQGNCPLGAAQAQCKAQCKPGFISTGTGCRPEICGWFNTGPFDASDALVGKFGYRYPWVSNSQCRPCRGCGSAVCELLYAYDGDRRYPTGKVRESHGRWRSPGDNCITLGQGDLTNPANWYAINGRQRNHLRMLECKYKRCW